MPTGRRRQRSSISSTPPADSSPSISTRTIRLRNSAGIARRTAARLSPGSIVAVSRPSSAPSAALARTVTGRGSAAGSDCTTTPNSFAARLGAAGRFGQQQARRVGLLGRDIAQRAAPVEIGGEVRGGPLPRLAAPAGSCSIPSLIHTARGALRQRHRRAAARARALRSAGHGFGFNACTAARASLARTGASGGGASPDASGAVVTRMTRRFSRSASARRSVAAVCRRVQSRAAAQPSSMTRTSGPSPGSAPRGLSSGCASARMISAASTVRSRISHHGVRAGVSSRGVSPSSSRIAGNATRRGAGGVTRSSHQITGSAASAVSSHGAAKASEPRASIQRGSLLPQPPVTGSRLRGGSSPPAQPPIGGERRAAPEAPDAARGRCGDSRASSRRDRAMSARPVAMHGGSARHNPRARPRPG